jgi:hypothetical protein
MRAHSRPGLAETLIVWALFALVSFEVFATYWRTSPGALYHVSGSGLEGAASRLLVYLGFPTSLIVIALLPIVVDRLATRTAAIVGLVAAGLCATVFVPGVVDQGDLDARPVNALAPVGVALALALTAAALARGGIGASAPFGGLDWVRVGLALVLAFAAVPWIAADLGVSVTDVPLFGSVFLGEQLRTAPGEETRAAVHLGHHHGMDGVMVVWSVLLLSRVPARMKSAGLRIVLSWYLALGFVYGLANALQDFWLEQLVKRGTTSTSLPSVIRPSLSWAWTGILAATFLIWFVALRVVRVDQRPGGRQT